MRCAAELRPSAKFCDECGSPTAVLFADVVGSMDIAATVGAERLREWGTPATGVLVETLLDRDADGDVARAEAAIERLAAAQTDDGLVVRESWLLRLRALLARARGDAAAYAHLRDRHQDMAGTLGFEGHIASLTR